jgi:hypothetical protein
MTFNGENIEAVFDHITYKYDEADIYEMIDEAIPEFIDSDWEDDFDSEYDAYVETGRNEAENQVVSGIVQEALEDLDIELSTDEEIELFEMLQDEWDINLL